MYNGNIFVYKDLQYSVIWEFRFAEPIKFLKWAEYCFETGKEQIKSLLW